MKRFRRWALTSLTAVTLAFVTGCGSGDSESPTASGDDDIIDVSSLDVPTDPGKSDKISDKYKDLGTIDFGAEASGLFAVRYVGYRFTGKQGASVEISLTGDAAKKTDTLAWLYGPKSDTSWGTDGKPIASGDNEISPKFAKISHTLPADGEYLIVAAAKNTSYKTRSYTLSLKCASDSCTGGGVEPGENSAAAIRASFRDAWADGTVDATEAKSIIDAASKGGISPSEEGQFKTILSYSQDKFSTEAKTAFQTFVDKTLAELRTTVETIGGTSLGPIDDPRVLDKHKSYEYKPASGQLFVNGIRGEDVGQGRIADCFLVAALSSMAYSRPEILEQAFRVNSDGTVTATLYNQPYFGAEYEPVEFTIDTDLVFETGKIPLYARSPNTSELWVAMMEKALVMLEAAKSQLATPTYGSFSDGDLAGVVFTSVTGHSYTSIGSNSSGLKNVTPETIFSKVEAAMNADKAVAFRTYATGKLDYEDPDKPTYELNFHNDHSYAVLGVVSNSEGNFIRFRNPWGFNEPGDDGVDDGVFLMKASRVQQLFLGGFIED